MKWVGVYFVGFVLFLGGILLALGKAGVLNSIGPMWTAIGVLILLGAGVMAAVKGSGTKQMIEIDKN